MKDQLRISAMQLAGGISKRPPHLRTPGQLEDAQNLMLSVVDGISKRPGTKLDRVVALTAGGVYRILPFKREQDEEYHVVYGVVGSNFAIKAYRVDGNAATVTISADAQVYLNLNGATADQIRPVVIGDTIHFINTTVMVGTLPAVTYSLASTFTTYTLMVATTPADGSYHRTTSDDGEFLAGYWQYDVNGVTFATRTFPTVTGRYLASPFGTWDNTADQPFKFRIGFQRRSLSVTNATFTNATDTITKTGAFTEVRTGEYVYVSGGTGFTAAWYEVLSRTNDTVVIGNGIDTATGNVTVATPGADNADTALTGIGSYFEPSFNALTAPETMHDVAAAIQEAFEDAGAADTLVCWTETGYQTGYFTITAPYRGSGATFFGPYAASAGGTNIQATGYPFNGSSGTTTAGTGTVTVNDPDYLAVDDRWVTAVESGQADAQIDPDTMPVVMTRTQVGSTSVFTVAQQTFEQRSDGTPTTNPSPSLWNKPGATQGNITAITAANDRITSASHGLAVGDTVHITGSDSTPTADGARVVATVPTADTFTVGVNFTVDGTTGVWRKGGNKIADACIKDSRLMYAGGKAVVFSQANDQDDFYIADVQNLVDSDRIDAPLGSQVATNVDFLVPFHKTVVAFTQAGQQFELNTPDALTPSTAGWNTSTTHVSRSVRPKVSNSRLYFVGEAANYSILFEYTYNDITIASTAFEVTTHVLDLLPDEIVSIDVSANTGVVIVLPSDDGQTARMFVYKAFWQGDEKVQSAWCRWSFDGGYRICDICVLNDELWLLVESCGLFTSAAGNPNTTITSASHGFSNGDTVVIPDGAYPASLSGSWTVANAATNTFTIALVTTESGYGKLGSGEYTLEKMPLSRDATRRGWAYTTHLDRQVELTGSHSAGTTTWTLVAPNGGNLTAEGSTLNRIVLGPAFGGSSGVVVNIGGYGATNTVTATGNYSAGVAVLGRYFDAEAELTRPFVRDQAGNVDLLGTVCTSALMVAHFNSGPYSVVVNYAEGQADVTVTFTPTATLSAATDSIFRAQASGEVEKFTATITSSDPKPMTLSAIQWIGGVSDILR